MDAKRGYVPEDDRNFSPDAIEILKRASKHISYLINEGYDLKQASVFVGNHYLLSERQRLAIMRSIATRQQVSARKNRQIPLGNLTGEEVWIDGFNTIITLEVMESGGLLFECMDGTVRDLAALRGTYRVIDETKTAVNRMLDILRDVSADKVNILLDQPVSNSGRLKKLIADAAEEKQSPFELDIQIQRDVDRMLYGKDRVVTSDSVILDHCVSWVNLAAECAAGAGKHGIRVWEDDHEQKTSSIL